MSGSCRIRTTSRSCASCRASPRPFGPTSSDQPVTERFLAFLHEFLAFAIPAYVGEGKTRPDDRDRLHRRLPSLDRDRRSPGGLAPRSRTSGRCRSSTGSSTGNDPASACRDRWPAALVRLGRRDQALARWSSSSASSGWPSVAPSPCARSIATATIDRPAPGRPVPRAPSSSCRTSCAGPDPRGPRHRRSSPTGSYEVLQVLMGPYRSRDDDQPLVELIYQKRFLARGPKIAALGGGHGLSTLLRGLKEHTSNLTAIVTVADDGGSSGKLRDQLGRPGGRRHPQLPRRPGRRRAVDERAVPVPLSRGGRRRRAWPGMRSATS